MADFKERFSDMQMWCQVACVEKSPCASVIAVTPALGSFCFQAGLMSGVLLRVALDCLCRVLQSLAYSSSKAAATVGSRCLYPLFSGTAALCVIHSRIKTLALRKNDGLLEVKHSQLQPSKMH